MNIIAKKGNLFDHECDLLVFGSHLGAQEFSGNLRQADKALGGLLLAAAADEDFSGKVGETVTVHTHGKLKADRVLLVGLGAKKTFNAETARRASSSAVRQAARFGAKEVILPAFSESIPAGELGRAVTEGALLADYEYLAFKPQEARRRTKNGVISIVLLEANDSRLRQAEKGIALGEVMSRATIYARDLVNEPGSRLTPSRLAEHARTLAAENRGISLKILDRDLCARLGMGAFLSVAAGSDEAPYFLHLVYKPRGAAKARKKIALVGKGITFDSGGLSLKPTWAMETMKSDMAGAAAVLGVFSVLDDLEPEAEIHGVIAACENMISGRAMRVGDIVTAMNGKSIEILNTDAEGRLALADSLSYVESKIKPDTVVDLATLTVAVLHALGPDIAGIMGNDENLLAKLEKSSERAGEALWRLPLPEDYMPLVAGDHSDLRNTGRVRWGDAILSGLFLREFAGRLPWAHIDIAGPAFAEREITPYARKGGTGFGVRLILEWLLSR